MSIPLQRSFWCIQNFWFSRIFFNQMEKNCLIVWQLLSYIEASPDMHNSATIHCMHRLQWHHFKLILYRLLQLILSWMVSNPFDVDENLLVWKSEKFPPDKNNCWLLSLNRWSGCYSFSDYYKKKTTVWKYFKNKSQSCGH